MESTQDITFGLPILFTVMVQWSNDAKVRDSIEEVFCNVAVKIMLQDEVPCTNRELFSSVILEQCFSWILSLFRVPIFHVIKPLIISVQYYGFNLVPR